MNFEEVIKKKAVLIFIITLIVLYASNNFSIYKIKSTSMSPYLNDGDIVLVKALRENDLIIRDDIILFDFDNSKMVKRVLGFEYDTLSFYQYDYKYKIDDMVFNTEKLRNGEKAPIYIKIAPEKTFKKNRIITMGDNITQSYFYIIEQESVSHELIFNLTKVLKFDF